MPSFSSALPIIKSVNELSEFLQVSEFELKRFCLRNEKFYHSFERAKKSGHGVRKICAPADALKKVQRRIKREILDKVNLHESCTGYRQGMSIVTNASIHVGQRFVLNMDIRDFFQSITSARVAGLFVSLGYDEEVALSLARLCCFRNAIPQGAPSSPTLANIVCHKLDRRLAGLAQARGLRYSRYCDDITVSGDKYFNEKLQDLIKKIIVEEGFTVNDEKTRMLSKRACQTVTGLTVNDKVSVPRRRRRNLRAAIHKGVPEGWPYDRKRNHLHGLAAYVSMVKNVARQIQLRKSL